MITYLGKPWGEWLSHPPGYDAQAVTEHDARQDGQLQILDSDPRLVCTSDRYERVNDLGACPYDDIGDFLQMLACSFPEEHLTIRDFYEGDDGTWSDREGIVLEPYRDPLALGGPDLRARRTNR